MIAFGIGEGIGNIIQCEPAIACLRAQGLKVYATKNSSWPRGWEVLEGRVDGFVDNLDPNVTEFIKGCWYRPFEFPNARDYHVPYELINQIDLHWKAANKFYNEKYGRSLTPPNPPVLSFPDCVETPGFIVVHPARSLSGWDLKHYKKWKELIDELQKIHPVMVMGTDNDVLEVDCMDYRISSECGPYWHIMNLKRYAKCLITSASGWAFLGPAIGIPTFVLWGPDNLKRNEPPKSHILTHDNCQQCFDVTEQGTKIPECPYNNKCMDFTPEEIISALKDKGIL